MFPVESVNFCPEMFDSRIITAGSISALVLLISSFASELSSTIRMYSYNTWFTFQVLIKFNMYLRKFEKWCKVSRPFPVSSVSGSVLLQSRHITHSDSWRHGFSADILQIYKIYQLQLHSHPQVNCTGFLLKAVQSQFNSRRGQGTWGIQQN